MDAVSLETNKYICLNMGLLLAQWKKKVFIFCVQPVHVRVSRGREADLHHQPRSLDRKQLSNVVFGGYNGGL